MEDRVLSLYKHAREYLELGIDADEQKEYVIALKSYQKCCELYITGIRIDRNYKRRTDTVEKVQRYLKRAETIKSKLPMRIRTQGLSKVAGLENVKQALKESILLPMLQPHLFKKGRKPWKGVLLFGPPGTGKSFIIQCLAEDIDCNFISISSSDIMSKFQGESEKAVKNLFLEAFQKIKETDQNCIIFIDEIDSIGGRRDKESDGTGTESHRRVLTELLRQMDGINNENERFRNKLIVIGATNHAEDLDFALRRRFEKRIYLPLPGIESRLEILKQTFRPIDSDENELNEKESIEHDISLKDLIDIARRTEGYSSADISILINEALMIPLRNILKTNYFLPVLSPSPSSSSSSSSTKTSSTLKFLTKIYYNSLINIYSLEQLKKSNIDYKLKPCSKYTPNAIKINILDKQFPSDKLIIPKVNINDLEEALKKQKPSVSEEEIKKHEKFAIQFSGDKLKNLRNKEDISDEELGYVDVNRTRIERRKKKQKKRVIPTTIFMLTSNSPKPLPV